MVSAVVPLLKSDPGVILKEGKETLKGVCVYVQVVLKVTNEF